MNIFKRIRTKRQQKEAYLKEIIALQHRLIEDVNDYMADIMTKEMDDDYAEIYIPKMDELCDRYFEDEELSKGLSADFRFYMHLWKKIQEERKIEEEES